MLYRIVYSTRLLSSLLLGYSLTNTFLIVAKVIYNNSINFYQRAKFTRSCLFQLFFISPTCNLKLLNPDTIWQSFVKYKHTNYIIFVGRCLWKNLCKGSSERVLCFVYYLLFYYLLFYYLL